MAENEATFVLTAEIQEMLADLKQVADQARKVGDEGKKGFEESGRAAEQFANIVTGVNAALELVSKGIGAVASVGAGLRSLVEEFAEQERAAISVSQALALQGAEVEQNTQRARDFADAQEKATGVGNELILQLEAQAIAQGVVGTQMERLVQAALDLSAATGQGLGESLRALTRSMQTGSVEIAGAGTLALDSADKFGRLGEALEEVEQRFKGFAQAQKEAATGASLFQDLDTALASLRKKLGEVISTTPEFQAVLDTLIFAIEDVTEGLGKNLPAATKLFGEIIGAVFRVVVNGAKLVQEQVSRIFSAFGDIADLLQRFGVLDDPFEGLRDGLREVAVELDVFNQKTDTGLAGQATAFENLRQKILEVADSADPTVAQISAITDEVDRLREAALIDLLDPAAADALDEALGSLTPFVEKMTEMEDAARNASEATEDVAGGLKQLIDDVLPDFTELADKFEEFAKNRSAAAQSSQPGFIGPQQNPFGTPTQGAGALTDELNKAQGASSRLRDSLDSLRDALKGTPKIEFLGNPEELVPKFEQLGDALRDAFLIILEGVPNSPLPTQFAETTESVKELLAEFGAGGADTASQIFELIGDDLDALSQKTPELKKRLDEIRGVLNGLKESAADLERQKAIDIEVKASFIGPKGSSTFEADFEKATSQVEDAARNFRDETDRALSDWESAGKESRDAARGLAESTAEFEAAANQQQEAAIKAEQAADEMDTAARAHQEAAAALKAGASAPSVGPGDSGLGNAAAALSNSAGDLRGAASAIVAAAGRLGSGSGQGQGQGYQLGGIVEVSTPFPFGRAGEAGPELILPLNDRGAGFLQQILQRLPGRGGGRGVVVQVSGNTFLSDNLGELAAEIERRIAERLATTSELRV